ncbi:transglycosylase SLT domain-containing protein [Roseibium denhamense]|nr:transporter substrate-binding domain-containing protein [Roseibium denhamense]
MFLAVVPFAGSASAFEQDLGAELEANLRKPFHGDFEDIQKRGYLRALVPFSKTFFFIDKGQQRGTSVDMMAEFKKFLDKRHGSKKFKNAIVLLPTPRENLFSDLAAGKGDIALGNLTITQERQKLVDFSDPIYNKAHEVPLTNDGFGALASADDLSGQDVHVRLSSSYADSLQKLNAKLKAAGKAPVNIVPVDEKLEDEDLLELVQAGTIPLIIIDEHKADFWMQILDGLKTHPDAAIRTDAQIAFAVRKDAPNLLAEMNAFAKTVEKGTLLGNIILKRYLTDAGYLKKLQSEDKATAFENLSGLFKKYGDKYSVDWLLIAAQSYQESRFDEKAHSNAGAVGLMQIKPSTAAGSPIEIKGVATNPDRNVEAGVKYLTYLANTYFDDLKGDPANQLFFALAAYNAGPARFDKIRREAKNAGYDPDKWFGNVEWIVGRRISYEPVKYVGNIYKYYVIFSKEAERRQTGADTSSD